MSVFYFNKKWQNILTYVPGVDLAVCSCEIRALPFSTPSRSTGVGALAPNHGCVTNLPRFAAIANLITATRFGLSPSLSSISHLDFLVGVCACVCIIKMSGLFVMGL